MPLRFSRSDTRPRQDVSSIGISHDENLDLLSAFRLCGFFRIDLDTGQLFATPDVYAIFGLACHAGPPNMVKCGPHIQPEEPVRPHRRLFRQRRLTIEHRPQFDEV